MESLTTFLGMDLITLAVISLCLSFSGFVKGSIGFGLPLIALSLLSLFIPVKMILAILVIPILTSNFWLSVSGGEFFRTLINFRLLLLGLCAGTLIGVSVLSMIDISLVNLTLGIIIVVFIGMELILPDFSFNDDSHSVVGMVCGLLAGVMGGVSASMGPPLTMYLTALNLPKEVFVRTLCTFFLVGGIVLAVALSGVNILNGDTAVLSAMASVPVFIGVEIGKRLRHRISQNYFKKGVLIMLAVIGVNLISKFYFS